MNNFVIVIFILSMVYTFYMGFVDGASAVASCIATHALKPGHALLVAAISMFVIPFIVCFCFHSDAVARTVGSLIETDAYLTVDSKKGFIFLLSALLAAGVWAIVSVVLVVPNSVSHTLLGGIVGAGMVCFGTSYVDWSAVGVKVILMVFLAPILGIIVGFLFEKLFIFIFKGFPRSIKKGFRFAQGINIVLLSGSIAINNVQKSMGVFLLSMVLCQGASFDLFEFSWWLVLVFAFIQCLGLGFGGQKLINAVGNKIFRLGTIQSNVAQLSTIGIALASSFMGLPISTGQVVSSSIMGVGAAERISAVRWLQAKKMILSWIITFPVSMILGAAIYKILELIVL